MAKKVWVAGKVEMPKWNWTIVNWLIDFIHSDLSERGEKNAG